MSVNLEHVLTHYYKDGMIAHMQSHPEIFDEAMTLAISDNQPYAWRAAWLLWSILEKNDKRVIKYIDNIIKVLPNKKDGHQRELLKILSVMELNDTQQGLIFDMCVGIWEQINRRPSVRFAAFNFILKIANKYPELKNEITFLN